MWFGGVCVCGVCGLVVVCVFVVCVVWWCVWFGGVCGLVVCVFDVAGVAADMVGPRILSTRTVSAKRILSLCHPIFEDLRLSEDLFSQLWPKFAKPAKMALKKSTSFIFLIQIYNLSECYLNN